MLVALEWSLKVILTIEYFTKLSLRKHENNTLERKENTKEIMKTIKEQGWLRMEKIDMDYRQRN